MYYTLILNNDGNSTMKNFIVYDTNSTVVLQYFDSLSAARRSATCRNRNTGSNRYAAVSVELFEQQTVKKIRVKNIMTGAEVEIDSDTPWACRPDSEAYWSN